MQIFRISLSLGTFIFACFLAQIYIVKYEHLFEHYHAFFTFGAVTFFIMIFIQPFHIFYKRARAEIFYSLWSGLIAPFGRVKFRDFFLADLMTSFVAPLRDLGMSVVFFASGKWW